MHISERTTQLPDQVIGKLITIASEHPEVISLGPGEPDFPAPKPIVQYTKKIAHKVSHYAPPQGYLNLREALAKKVRKENKIKWAMPDNVVVANGSQEALLMACDCCLDVSEQVIIPNPSYMSYAPTVELVGACPVFVELKEEADFAIDPDAVDKLVDHKKTKVLIINSPANPTGTVLRRKVLEQLADIAVEHDLAIFSDEAYEHIIYDGVKHISPASLNGMEDYVVSFFTFSKSFAMCGYRLGYAVAKKELIDDMKEVHVHTSVCAPSISQLLGIKALSLSKSYINKMVKEYDRRRKLIVNRLNDIGLPTPKPKGAFYSFSNIKHLSNNSRIFAFNLLKKQKVAVVPGSDFGRYGEGYIRCSYATDYKKIEKAMDRMEKFVKSFHLS